MLNSLPRPSTWCTTKGVAKRNVLLLAARSLGLPKMEKQHFLAHDASAAVELLELQLIIGVYGNLHRCHKWLAADACGTGA